MDTWHESDHPRTGSGQWAEKAHPEADEPHIDTNLPLPGPTPASEREDLLMRVDWLSGTETEPAAPGPEWAGWDMEWATRQRGRIQQRIREVDAALAAARKPPTCPEDMLTTITLVGSLTGKDYYGLLADTIREHGQEAIDGKTVWISLLPEYGKFLSCNEDEASRMTLWRTTLADELDGACDSLGKLRHDIYRQAEELAHTISTDPDTGAMVVRGHPVDVAAATYEGSQETNPYYNPDTAGNGGGYPQPERTWRLPDGTTIIHHDQSCGDFGSRHNLWVALPTGEQRTWVWGSMYDEDGTPTDTPPAWRNLLPRW